MQNIIGRKTPMRAPFFLLLLLGVLAAPVFAADAPAGEPGARIRGMCRMPPDGGDSGGQIPDGQPGA